MIVGRVVSAAAFSLVLGVAHAKTLVVAVPQSEFPALAEQMIDGANAALAEGWSVKAVDAGCTEERAAGVAGLIMAEMPDAVIGLPCIESLIPTLNALGPKGIPIFTIASRAAGPSNLATKQKWPLFRVGPREREESEATAKLIVEKWKNQAIAILDDGTLFSRDIAEAIRNAAETEGIKPVLVDGFQPQLESQKKLISRIVQAGATHVFIASDRSNIAQIASESEGSNLTIAGPETLRANDPDFPLPAEVLMIARDFKLTEAANARLAVARQTPFALVEGYAADAYVAAEMAFAYAADPKLRTFTTAGGTMNVSEDGFVLPNVFELFRFDGAMFQKVEQ